MTIAIFDGVKVLDLTTYLAGPYATALLGDLGADVIKIEPPGGDMMRHYPSSLPGDSRAFIGVNRNKRSIVIDLKQPDGLAVFLRMVAGADVVVQNFRPGVAEGLSIDAPRLRALNPRLVCCSLTGFGTSGPMMDFPGFDQVVQSMTGVAALQGLAEGEPKIVWGSIIDYFSASMLAFGISSALYRRERTGEGQDVDTSLLRSALTLQAGRLVWAEGEARDVERDMRLGRVSGIHPTKEGHIYIQAQTPPFWRALCMRLELPDLATDPRFDDMRKRKAQEPTLLPLIRTALARRTAVEWERILGGHVPCALVRPVEDMFDHPQVIEQQMMATLTHPSLGRYSAVTAPILIGDRGTAAPDRPAPTIGQHTREILSEFGVSADELSRLGAAGAVR
jgi:crotonobetainyl-CoA:carnitine CoA-transferase CaiB-like acyl-CoA transferase